MCLLSKPASPWLWAVGQLVLVLMPSAVAAVVPMLPLLPATPVLNRASVLPVPVVSFWYLALHLDEALRAIVIKSWTFQAAAFQTMMMVRLCGLFLQPAPLYQDRFCAGLKQEPAL